MSVDIKYYTPQQIADLLGVDVELILGWISNGELQAHDVCKKPGGKRPTWRVAEAELARLLLRRKYGTVKTTEPVAKPRQADKPAQEFV